MITATVEEVQDDFEKYLSMVQDAGEIIILKNGKEAARLVSGSKRASFLTDSLVGVLKGDYDDKAARLEKMEKQESAD